MSHASEAYHLKYALFFKVRGGAQYFSTMIWWGGSVMKISRRGECHVNLERVDLPYVHRPHGSGLPCQNPHDSGPIQWVRRAEALRRRVSRVWRDS